MVTRGNSNDSEGTTTSPDLGLKIQILRRRDEFIDVFRSEQELRFKGVRVPFTSSRSYLIALYLAVQVLYMRTTKADLMPAIKEAKTVEEFQMVFFELEEFLYDKGYTRPRLFSDLKSPERID